MNTIEMKLYFAVFLMAGLVAVNSQGSFRCYNCKGSECEDLKEEMLEFCPLPQTTSTPSPEDTSTTPSLSTEIETSSSQTTPSSSTATESSSSQTTPSSSTATETSSSETTPSPSTASETSSSETTPSLSTASEISSSETTPSPSTASETSSSETTPSLSTASEISSSETTPSSSTVTSSTSEEPKPSISSKGLVRNYRSISRNVRADDFSYACYAIYYKENGDDTQSRGCVKVATDQSACDAAKSELELQESSVSRCDQCLMDKCNGNGSTTLKVSLTALLAVILVKFSI